MGDDKFSWATMFSPPITAVAQPSYEIGKIAMESLLEEIEGKTKGLRASKRVVVKLKAELRIRESTAPPPGHTLPVEDEQQTPTGSRQ
jgi:DNA-binding LacI/PurR family transcriptional regulator